MSLNNSDKKWISDEMVRLREVSKPKGWQNAIKWLKEWGLLVPAIGVPIALLAIIATIANIAYGRIDREARFQIKTETRLDGIEKRLNAIDERFKGLDDRLDKVLLLFPPGPTLKTLAERIRKEPTDTDFAKVAQTIGEARASGQATVPAAFVESLGVDCIRAATQSTGPKAQLAWKAGLSLAGYRSFVQVIRFSYSVGQIGVLAENVTLKGVGAQKLDGIAWRNATFSNTKVYYHGGPVLLENVTFENCTFEFERAPNSTKLVMALLTRSSQDAAGD